MNLRSTTPSFLLLTLYVTCIGIPAGVSRAAEPPADPTATIDRILITAMEKGNYPGISVAVQHRGKVIYSKGHGYADLEHKLPMTADTVMPIGSATKSFTALAAMQLVDAGKLSLDAPVSAYFPEYAGPVKNVLVRQLMNHTSGMQNYTSDPQMPDMQTPLPKAKVIALVIDDILEFEPGAKFRYNNSDTYLLGMIVERVSGVPLGAYFKQHILDPFGMSDTRLGDYKDVIPRRGRGYELSPAGLRNGKQWDVNFPFAAGSMLSTASDLMKYRDGVFGPLTKPAIRDRLLTLDPLKDGTPHQYALGALLVQSELGRKKISHSGRISGFATQYAYYPDDDLAIAVIVNLGSPRISPGSVERKIAREVLNLPQPKIADLPPGEADLARFTGEFSPTPISYGPRKLRFAARDGRLHLTSVDPPLRLLYQGEGAFLSAADDEVVYRFEASEGPTPGVQIGVQDTTTRAVRLGK